MSKREPQAGSTCELKKCALCRVRVVKSRRHKHCRRACTVRAADLRRCGKPPVDRGYQPQMRGSTFKWASVTACEVQRRIRSRRKAERHRDAAALQVVKDALQALKRHLRETGEPESVKP